MNRARNKRRQYFIDKDFQTRFILKFCILVVLAGIINVGILYFVGKESTTVSIVNSRVIVRTTADFLLPILIQTFLIMMILKSLHHSQWRLFPHIWKIPCQGKDAYFL